jgi:hypothetical protein
VALAGFIGTAIEYYGFYIYGLADVLIFFRLSDAAGRPRLALGGTAFAGLWTFPMFYLLDTGSPDLISLGFSVNMFAWAAIYDPLGAFFSGLFGTRVRYSGAALSFALGGVFGGALVPLLAVRILRVTGSIVWVAAYLFGMALISLAAIYYSLREAYGKDLADIYPAERALVETR